MKKEAPPPVITKNTLMWFRNDLRVQDNRALHEASKRARIGEKKCIIGLYIISESEWASHDEAPVKIDFWMRNLAELRRALDKLNIPLIVRRAGSKTEVEGLLESIVKELDISHVFWNAEYMVDEVKRDNAVKKALVKLPGVYVEQSEDQCVVPPKEIKTKVCCTMTFKFCAPASQDLFKSFADPEQCLFCGRNRLDNLSQHSSLSAMHGTHLWRPTPTT